MRTLNSEKLMRSSRWLSFAMLVVLHFALWLGMQSLWMRPFLLMHLGLFLLWQPLWRGEIKLRTGSAAFIIAMSLVALFFLNWWVLAFWVSMLFALVGGRVFAFYARWQRLYYLLVMAYLLAILILYIAPNLFALPALGEVIVNMMNVGLPLLLISMAIIPVERAQAETEQAVDFIYILLLFTLLTLLVLGSLAFMTLGQIGYLDALLRTLFIIAVMLLALGGLWNPRLGFSGFQALFSRYLLTIGTPLEIWLERLAEAAHQEQNPEAFLGHATEYLTEMPWISGLSWVSDNGHGTLGIIQPASNRDVRSGLEPHPVQSSGSLAHRDVACAPAHPVVGAFLPSQAARTISARDHAPAGHLRDRSATYPRPQEHVAISVRADICSTASAAKGAAYLATPVASADTTHRTHTVQTQVTANAG